MSFTINTVTLGGNLTRDPELRQAGESQVCSFALAVNRKYRDRSGELQEDVTFVDVECWGRSGEIVGQYLSKGAPLAVTGEIRQDRWEDKDGNKRSKLKVVARSVHLVPHAGGRPADPSEGAPSEPVTGVPAGAAGNGSAGAPTAADEPPF